MAEVFKCPECGAESDEAFTCEGIGAGDSTDQPRNHPAVEVTETTEVADNTTDAGDDEVVVAEGAPGGDDPAEAPTPDTDDGGENDTPEAVAELDANNGDTPGGSAPGTSHA